MATLKDQIREHQRRLGALEVQRAQQGIHTDAAIVNEIEDIYKILNQLMIQDIVLEEVKPPRFRGLIVLIGPGQAGRDPFDQSAMDAIEYHIKALEYCWMIGSSGERGSAPVIEKMEQECADRGVKSFARYVDDPFSVQPTYELVEKIYTSEIAEAGLAEQDVIADITGATKPMSFGMLRACGIGRPMEYMVRQTGGHSSVPMMLKYSLDASV